MQPVFCHHRFAGVRLPGGSLGGEAVPHLFLLVYDLDDHKLHEGDQGYGVDHA
jgi:hypothetical protein